MNEQAIRQELELVLASSGFARNERLSGFLRFVVERHLAARDEEIKESLIAVEVFRRKPDYDPKVDSIVRTEAGRLRARLAEYYAGPGSVDPIVIELPKGGYVPLVRPAEVQRAAEAARSGRQRLAVALAAGVFVLAGAGWWLAERPRAPITIAVLPLETLDRDPSSADFADGLTDEIIRNLSVIDGLQVRSAMSSFALKGKPSNVREAGRLLQVDYILEGSLLRAGQQLRISARLVRVRDDASVWSQRFDRELTDVFAIQDEVSLGIVNNLRLRLGRGRRRYETSVEAYDLYLRARATMFQSGSGEAGADAFARRVGLYQRVIATDSSFAPAHAALAQLYAIRSIQFPPDHSEDELANMRATAEKAIQLDPLLAEAHDSLALMYARDSQWTLAENSFRRAIELEPSRSATYSHFAARFLLVLGRVEEALDLLRRAQAGDPLSSDIRGNLALGLILAGRFDEVAEHCLKLSERDLFRTQCLGRSQLGQGSIAEAVKTFAEDPALSRNPQARGFLGYAYARSGRRDEAEKMALASSYPNEQALIFAGLGDQDRTLDALDRMTRLGAQRIGVYLRFHEFDFLRAHSRLEAIRQKVGLPR